jgi:hypothetical protein
MSAAEMQEEIERTRAQLGQTVDELAAKADVKAMAKEKAAQMRAKALQRAGQAQRTAVAKAGQAQTVARRVVLGRIPVGRVAGALAVAVVATVAVRRWRRK